MIELYTDGAAQGNPGPGGYGLILRSGKHYKEMSEGFERTTNNRMELLAVIVGLEQIKQPGSAVMVYSDSKYVVDATEKGWIKGWQARGFKKVKNVDLWKRFIQIAAKHKVKFTWIRGHAGHPENERCDQLAVAAANMAKKSIDHGYLESLAAGEQNFFEGE
ncbi:MAG TPA: ribonuclease HI [Flavobacteriales bacterium]|nr:ribonuclease HI [Flavobacteriales bacterium]